MSEELVFGRRHALGRPQRFTSGGIREDKVLPLTPAFSLIPSGLRGRGKYKSFFTFLNYVLPRAFAKDQASKRALPTRCGPPFHSAVIPARVSTASNMARARASSSSASAAARACPNTFPASDCANIRASSSICLRRVLSRFTGIESPCFNAFRLERALPAEVFGPRPSLVSHCAGLQQFIDQDPLDWSFRTEFLNDRFTHAAVDRNLLGIYHRPQRLWRASQPTRRAQDLAGNFFSDRCHRWAPLTQLPGTKPGQRCRIFVAGELCGASPISGRTRHDFRKAPNCDVSGGANPSHHSITSSASCWSCTGTSRPIALAVLRLITRLHTGCTVAPDAAPNGRVRLRTTQRCALLARRLALRSPRGAAAIAALVAGDGRRASRPRGLASELTRPPQRRALEEPTCLAPRPFAPLLSVLLLTGQRRNEVAGMFQVAPSSLSFVIFS